MELLKERKLRREQEKRDLANLLDNFIFSNLPSSDLITKREALKANIKDLEQQQRYLTSLLPNSKQRSYEDKQVKNAIIRRLEKELPAIQSMVNVELHEAIKKREELDFNSRKIATEIESMSILVEKAREVQRAVDKLNRIIDKRQLEEARYVAEANASKEEAGKG